MAVEVEEGSSSIVVVEYTETGGTKWIEVMGASSLTKTGARNLRQ